jgi:pilus assembly protein TadC
MPRIDERLKKTTWIVSIMLAGAIMSYGFLRFWSTDTFDDFVFFAVIVSVFPSAMLNYSDYKWRKAVDEHLPDLFRSIVQAQETGMTLPQAVEQASKRNLGNEL